VLRRFGKQATRAQQEYQRRGAVGRHVLLRRA
jgi:hypothetical protein